jgi:hypothetical protein
MIRCLNFVMSVLVSDLRTVFGGDVLLSRQLYEVRLRASMSLKRLNMRGVMTDLSLSLSLSRRDFTIAAMNFPNPTRVFLNVSMGWWSIRLL